MRKLFSLLAAVLFASGMMANQVDLKYTAGVTTNMVGNGTNNAATVNLDPALFVVLSVKDSASNEVGLNKANDIRLYAHKNSGCGNALNVSIVAGTIDSIKLDIKQSATFTVHAITGEDSVAVTLTNDKYVIDAPMFAIKNVTKGNTTQLQLNKITVFYTPDASFVAAPTFEPAEKVFKDMVEVTIVTEEGNNIYYTLDESDPTVESTLYAGPFVLNATATVKAIAENDGHTSAVAEKLYKRADTLTVAEAKAATEALAVNATSDKVFVEGYAVSVATYSQQYGNQDFYLVDTLSETPDSTFMIYRAVPEKDGGAYPVYDGDKVRLFGALKKYQASGKPVVLEMVEATVEFIEEVERPAEPVHLDTITIAEAIEIGDALENKAYSEKEYVVEGFVIKAEDFYMANKNQTWSMVDDPADKSSRFKAYRCVPVFNEDTVQVLNGDKVRLLGKLQKFVQGTDTLIEISYAQAEFISMVEGDHTAGAEMQQTIDTISVARALEIGGALADGGVSDDKYVIFGYVSNIVNYYDTINKNETFWMVDSLGGRAKTNAAGAFEVYHGVPDIQAEIGLDAKVYVTSKIKKYKATSGAITIETDGTPVVVVAEIGHEEVIEAITVAQAIEIGTNLTSGQATDNRYEITGYVSNVYNFFNADYNNETVWITDDPNSTSADKANAFQIYRGKPNTQAEVGYGAKVKVVTTITNYSGTIESASSVAFEVLEPSTFVPDTITVEDAIAMTANLADGEKLPTYSVVKGFVRAVTGAYDSKNGNATFSIADYATGTASMADAYRTTILKADAEKVAVGSYAVVTGYLMKKGGATQLAQGSITAFEEAPVYETIYATPSEALAAGQALEDNKRTQNMYVVTGYVARANEYDPEDDDFQTFWLADEKGGEAVFKALNAKVPGDGVKVGDKVALTGNVFKYVAGEDVSVYIEQGEVELIPEEGIENIVLTEQAQKVVVDGVMYIIRDGKMFNAQGVQVR